MAKSAKIESFWTMPSTALFERLDTAPTGLSETEAKQRLQLYGPNRLRPSRRTDALTLLAAQFKSPLILILLVAVVLSFFFNESIDALIIIAIILLSSLLGFWQEKRAADAVKSLLSIVKMEATVLRDGVEANVPVEDVVPGDVCLLNAGGISRSTVMREIRRKRLACYRARRTLRFSEEHITKYLERVEQGAK